VHRVVVTLLILTAIAVIGPLASATPPDDTWIGGLYDDADYDDVVAAVLGMISAAPVFVAVATLAPPMLGRVPGPHCELLTAVAPPTRRDRAPPIIALLQGH
jgi:hypothetical protein